MLHEILNLKSNLTPQVKELELGTDIASVNNLLEFLEKVFNGGSDFNEPIRRCLSRLTEAKWGNSDILLVSDGELRQPGQEIMRKLAGAKDKLGLRVHGLIVGEYENFWNILNRNAR